MINARVLLFALLVAKDAWAYCLDHLTFRHLKQPMPKEVSGIHDADSWNSFMEISQKEEGLCLVNDVCARLVDFALIFSPFFAWIDALARQDMLLAFILTTVLVSLAHTPVSYVTALISEFKVKNRYGQSNISIAEFNRDYIVNEISQLTVNCLSLCLVIGLCSPSIERFSVAATDHGTALIEILGLFPPIIAITLVAALVTLGMEFATYKFKPLPQGELRTRIERMLVGCRKRVRWLTVYNESAKSNETNAFALNIPGFRMISVADNVTEEDTSQILAIAAHEVGHLKHRFQPYDLLGFIAPACIFGLLGLCLWSAESLLPFDAWVRGSFNITNVSAYLVLQYMGLATRPIAYLCEIPTNYVSRKHELEADANAVAEGYGKDLTEYFKASSKKELRNVNPHPLVEFLEFSHPALPKRLRAIEDAMRQGPFGTGGNTIAPERI